MTREPATVISCEHGGTQIPSKLRRHVTIPQKVLRSHRGFDRGALALATRLADALDAPLRAVETTRLVFDCNRSKTDHEFYSRYSPVGKQHLLAQYEQQIYDTHRELLLNDIRHRLTKHSSVVHIGVHTFTPIRKGVRRTTDIGLLYDPKKPAERTFVHAWRNALKAQFPLLKIHLNAPYQGYSDGLTTTFRKLLGSRYLGIELEVNQRFVKENKVREAIVHGLISSTISLIGR